MIKFEFPADRKDIALAIGQALVAIGSDKALVKNSPAPSVVEQAAPKPDQSVTPDPKDEVVHVADGEAPQVDEKGVPFNPETCSRAAVPFYGSGKKKGQWKKRQGVEEDAYDEWYADALLGDRIEDEAVADEDAPRDVGQLMRWVSEQQAAGNITQDQVTGAYSALELPFDAVLNPKYPVADNCAAIYNHLKSLVG